MKIIFEDFSRRENELIIKISHLTCILKDTNSKRHINLGFSNRFSMLKIARDKMIQIIQARSDNSLDCEEASWLNYYLTLTILI